MDQAEKDIRFMAEALKQAEYAASSDEVPVGAVVVCKDQIIARAYNYVQHLHDVTAHAEMQAITSAANFLGGKILEGCTVYVTLEPCPMCAGALYHARPARVVYGATDLKNGYSLVTPNLMHPKTEVVPDVLNLECGQLLTNYFASKRT